MMMTGFGKKTLQALAISLAGAFWLMAGASVSAGQSNLPKRDANTIGEQSPAPVLLQRPRYKIHPGDVLVVSFPISPDYNQTATVTPDGYVSLLGAGSVYLVGKTLPQARKALYTAYTKILHDPLIDVNLKTFQEPHFVVSGQVAHPGRFNLLGQDVTVVEGLAMAGGETPNAKTSQVLLFRRMPGGSMVEVRKLNLKKMLKKGNLVEDPILQAGDMVYVPQTTMSKISRYLPTSSLGVYAAPTGY